MRVFHSKLFSGIPGIVHGTASLDFKPLTFRGHRRTEVEHNRKKLFNTLGLTPGQAVFGNQVHGSSARIVSSDDSGAGWSSPKTYIPATDGLLTQRPNLAVGVFTADCVPVLLADPVSGWIGAIHVGWKGAANGILIKAIKVLKQQNVEPENLKAWIGPCICDQCYSIFNTYRIKLLSKALGSDALKRKGGLVYINFRLGISRQLIKSGLQKFNIDVSGICTKTCAALPSARRDGYDKHENTLTVISRKADTLDLRGKNVVVFGLGTQGGGEASAKYAYENFASVTVVDEKPISHFTSVIKRLNNPALRLKFGKNIQPALNKADIIIKNPGIQTNRRELIEAKKHGAIVIGDHGLFRAKSTNPLIAITGTKGKTTVATWIADMLKISNKKTVLAGNLRQSPLLIPAAFDGKTPVVLEVSSFQLEDTKDLPLRPKLSIITNIFPDHLNRYGNLGKYAEAKSILLHGQTKSDSVILPFDESWSKKFSKLNQAKKYWFSSENQPKADAWIAKNILYVRWQGKKQQIFDLSKLHVTSGAFRINAVIVALAGFICRIPKKQIQKSLQQFSGAPYRYELIRVLRGRRFINDTTATNPGAAVININSTPSPCILIAGGSDKQLPLENLAKTINSNIKEVILLPGSATNKLRKLLKLHISQVTSMAGAVKIAWRLSKPGYTILLSPGAASFGLFKNEFDRGDQFNNLVKKLK